MSPLQGTHCVKSIRIRSFSGQHFSHIRTEYRDLLCKCQQISVFSPNVGKYGPETLGKRTLFIEGSKVLSYTISTSATYAGISWRKCWMNYLQSSTKYLRVTLVFMLNTAYVKFSFLGADWALGYHYMKFRHFPDIS